MMLLASFEIKGIKGLRLHSFHIKLLLSGSSGIPSCSDSQCPFLLTTARGINKGKTFALYRLVSLFKIDRKRKNHSAFKFENTKNQAICCFFTRFLHFNLHIYHISKRMVEWMSVAFFSPMWPHSPFSKVIFFFNWFVWFFWGCFSVWPFCLAHVSALHQSQFQTIPVLGS